jgi:FlaA1/EpsC-like NDP-sugar epimerase
VLALFGSALIATIGLILANQALPTPLPAAMLMVVGLVSWLGFVVVRYRLRLVSGAAQHWLNLRPATSFVGERTLIVGSGIVGRWAAALVGESELLPNYRVVGWVDDNVRRRDSQIGGYRVLGTTAEIGSLVRKYDIGVIVFAIMECGEHDRRRILDHCYQTPARVIILSEIVAGIQDAFAS